jgi:precorrin-3B synthase
VTVRAPRRRTSADRCPGSMSLYEAADGWLARVRVPGGRIGTKQLKALVPACALGNGLVEITSRANLQLRGLPAGADRELAASLHGAGLLPSRTHDRVRNILASPLAGRHPRARANTDALVAELDRRLCAEPELAELSGRFLFAVDDGSGLALTHPADVALVARDEQTYVLGVGGRAGPERVPAGQAAAIAVGVASRFLATRRRVGSGAWRIAELHGRSSIPERPSGHGMSPGRLVQRDGRVAVTALAPLGQLDVRCLKRLAALTAEVRLGSGRTVTVLDLDGNEATHIEREFRALGLVLDSASGWAGLSACAGLGRCTGARLDVRAAAVSRAQARAPGALPEHWAACERCCGEPGGTAVVISADGDGISVRSDDSDCRVGTLDEALAALG